MYIWKRMYSREGYVSLSMAYILKYISIIHMYILKKVGIFWSSMWSPLFWPERNSVVIWFLQKEILEHVNFVSFEVAFFDRKEILVVVICFLPTEILVEFSWPLIYWPWHIITRAKTYDCRILHEFYIGILIENLICFLTYIN